MGLAGQVGRWGLVAAVCAASAVAEAPKTARKAAGPSQRITLESIHAPGVSANFLKAGASMLTLNVLDDTHLLVTFATKDLVPRLPDDPKDDEDRIVAAEVVELPSGKVVAQTRWHLHDHARYLWPLGDGRFAVRIQDSLSMIAPMERMANPQTAKEPFLRITLHHQRGLPQAVVRSADAELFSVITELPSPKNKPAVLGDAEAAQHMYAIEFFRLHGDGLTLEVKPAGGVKSALPLALPLDADGYLWPVDDSGKGHWAVGFHGFGGQTIKAGTVESSCAPRLAMASRSQYLALTCRGTDTQPKLQAMGLDGFEPWEENFGEFAEVPTFVFAPQAGRFAMLSTTVTQVSGSAGAAVTESTNQEVRVYQIESGDLLQKVSCSPAFRVPENFDLSASGRTLAVLHETEILVYALPELSKKDREDLAEVEKLKPQASEGVVSLGALAKESARPTTENAKEEQQALSAPVTTTTSAATGLPGAEAGATARKKPTLLNPGEQPEFKDKP